ncbi:MAG: GDSL-type esterase/lipase family protein [Kineosporiaceae bacterium]
MTGRGRDAGAPEPYAVAVRGPAGRERELRICVVGDDLVAGVGDARSLGWVGRVGARTPREETPIALFPLGVPDETTAGLLGRWREEADRRFTGAALDDCRLVVGLGRHDVYAGVSLPRSRLNLANVLDECANRGLAAFVVGPPPGPHDRLNASIAELSAAFHDVCLRRRVPYVDTFTPLVAHEDWLTDLAAGDGVHPGQAGYGLIAWLVLHGGWRTWLGLPEV